VSVECAAIRPTCMMTRLKHVNHDADAKLHEGFAEVNDAFSHWRYRQRRYSHIRLLADTSQTTGLIRCRTYDREVVASTPRRVTIAWLLLGWVTVCEQVKRSRI